VDDEDEGTSQVTTESRSPSCFRSEDGSEWVMIAHSRWWHSLLPNTGGPLFFNTDFAWDFTWPKITQWQWWAVSKVSSVGDRKSAACWTSL